MSLKVLKCLVTITRAIADPRVVPCALDGDNSFLLIPVEDYALPQAGGRAKMKLGTPLAWFAEVSAPQHDLLCRYIVNLDKFDELPWMDPPTPPVG